MHLKALKLHGTHKAWLLGSLGLSFASGVAWWVLTHVVREESDLGASSPWESWMLKIHGGAAMLSLLMLGSLIPVHIKRGLQAGLNRLTAWLLMSAMGLMIVTGYALYYFATTESSREIVGNIHLTAGLLSPFLLMWHIKSGRKAVSKEQAANPTETWGVGKGD